jgi:hypothetical protein
VHPDGTENQQIATDVAEQQLLPDWSPRWGTAGLHHPWRID